MALCTEIAQDGLHCGPDWPRCIGTIPDDAAMVEGCRTTGCYWRKFHSIPADKLRAKPQSESQQGELGL